MRKMMVAMTLAAVLVAGAVPNTADAGPPKTADVATSAAMPVQYYSPYGAPAYLDRRDERWRWREHRRARDEARIAEAARREAMQIYRERAERRAWRHAQRQHDSYHRGW